MELQKLETELKLRAFSPETVRSYLYWNKDFLKTLEKKPEEVTEDDVKNYIAKKLSDGLEPKSIVLIRAALKFFYDEILGKGIIKLKSPKISKKLPVVLTKEEIRLLINSIKNKKHKLIVMLLYSSGLRVSEMLNLKVGDLELGEGIGWVRSGKGAKDRLFLLSNKLVEELKEYIQDKKDSDYVFTGRSGRMTPRSVQKIIKRAIKTAGIEKDCHPHSLRHSFATHLLESGENIRKIQLILGHSQLSTTQLYLNISTEELRKIKNPLDDM